MYMYVYIMHQIIAHFITVHISHVYTGVLSRVERVINAHPAVYMLCDNVR